MSTVYWITGFAGAGKTTIGKQLYEYLKNRYPNTVFLDGDVMRQVFGDDLGYTEQDRRKCAMRYARLCRMLQEQNMNVICCTVSMFESVREWNREHIVNYREIYVKVTKETLVRRNQKGLYTREIKTEVAGISFAVEEPRNPDLILENDDIPVELQLKRIYEQWEELA